MYIKLLSGSYGHKENGGSVKLMTPADPPFEVTKERGERLIKLKIAKEVNKPSKDDAQVNDVGDDEQGEKSYNDYTVAELTSILLEKGIEIPKKSKKVDLYNLVIQSLEDDSSEDKEDDDMNDDEETPPVFEPQLPV